MLEYYSALKNREHDFLFFFKLRNTGLSTEKCFASKAISLVLTNNKS